MLAPSAWSLTQRSTQASSGHSPMQPAKIRHADDAPQASYCGLQVSDSEPLVQLSKLPPPPPLVALAALAAVVPPMGYSAHTPSTSSSSRLRVDEPAT